MNPKTRRRIVPATLLALGIAAAVTFAQMGNQMFCFQQMTKSCCELVTT